MEVAGLMILEEGHGIRGTVADAAIDFSCPSRIEQ
jgi:hypothetical protein